MQVNRYLNGFTRAVLWTALIGVEANSQTQIDLRTQARNVDFSSALSTKPIRTGSTLPATCSAGEAFFLTTAAAGQNLNLCTAPDIWTVQGGSGVAATPGADVGPSVIPSNAVTLAVGGNCSLATPCHARIGGTAYTFVGSSAIIVASGNPTIRVYISDGTDGAPPGTLKVRNSASGGVTCSGACVVENGQTSFPGASIPLAMWTATIPGTWDGAGTDFRTALTASPMPVAGTGIVITQGTSTSVAIDPAVVTRKFGGSGPPGNIGGSTLGDLYVDTANNVTYQCFSAGPCGAAGPQNWVKVVFGSGTPVDTTAVPKKYSGSGVPAAVNGSTLGDFYQDVANNDTYQCFQATTCTTAAPGNWVKVDSSGAGPTVVTGAYTNSSAKNYFGLYAVAGLPDAATFAWANQPTGATVSAAGVHGFHMTVPAPAANGDNLALLTDRAGLPGSAFTLNATLMGCSPQVAVNYATCGIAITDGTKFVSFGLSSIYGGSGLAVTHWTNASTANGFATYQYLPAPYQISSFRITLSGGMLSFYSSCDAGASYDLFYSESATAFLSSASGLSAGWAINNNWTNGPAAATLMSWGVN